MAMVKTTPDEQLLLELLNSTPQTDDSRTDGDMTDALAGDGVRDWLRARGGTGSRAELERCRSVRDDLQRVVCGDSSPEVLSAYLDNVVNVPQLTDGGLRWSLRASDDHLLGARAVLSWATITSDLPGSLRPCANDECRLFLLDRSRAGTARWCSMAVCGNRMKARRHRARAVTG